MDLTRRYFMKSTGALAVYLGVSPAGAALLPRPTLRPKVARGKTLVVIFLRGGADGLNLVVPYGDQAYADLRPSLRIPAPAQGNAAAALDLDGYFGLHPRLQALTPVFEQNMAVAAHAVGYAHNTRSHFEEQDTWETGVIGNTVASDGWLNRHLATSEGHGPIRAVSIGDALPRILQGKAPAYAIRGLDDLTMPQTRGDPSAVAAALEHAYCVDPAEHRADARDVLVEAGQTTLDGMKQLEDLAGQEYRPAAPYPQGQFAQRLRQVAQLIKADIGVEVVEVGLGGWDTHANQGQGAGGQFGNLAQQLGDALGAFSADLADRMDDVCVVTLTDFGRTAAENGTRGTDHGWANSMFLVGGPVARANRAAAGEGRERRVVTNWPGLAPDQLHQGRDLLHTTDFRDVIGELVSVHLGNPGIEAVLPDHEFTRPGLVV